MNVVLYYRQINSWVSRSSSTLSDSRMFIIKKNFSTLLDCLKTNRKNPASQPTRRGRGMMALEMYAYYFHLFFCFLPDCPLLTTVSDLSLFFLASCSSILASLTSSLPRRRNLFTYLLLKQILRGKSTVHNS